MKYALVLLIAVSVSFALIPWSFRYQSTANLFEDDYDLLFDPARMPEIDGSRLYTSLANFVTGGENLFSNYSVPFILIGGSTKYMDYYPGFVLDRSSFKNALYTGLGPEDDPLYGEGEVTTTTWQDTTGDGTPDITTTESEKRLAYDKEDEADYYLGIAKKFNSLRFGLGFMRQEYKNTYTDPDNNVNYALTVYDEIGNDFTYLDSATSAGDNVFNSTDNDFILSLWYDSDNWSLGVRTGYGMFGLQDQAIIAGREAEYSDPTEMDSLHTINTSLDSLDAPQSGTRIPIYLTLFYNYSENAQGRFYLGYRMESHKYKDGAIDFVTATGEEIYNDYTLTYDTTITNISGEGNTNTISAGTKHLWKVNPRLNFGMGVLFSTASFSDSVNHVDASTEVLDYNDGDTISSEYDDYVQTSTYTETWMTTTDGSVKSFTFPVGVEFFVLNNALCFRLGATHTLSFTENTIVNEMVDYEPGVTTIVYGNDTTYESIQDNGEIPATTEIIKETTSYTNYAFGLGWNVNKNFHLDLMGFSDLTDMSNWRLSAKFMFD